MTRTHRFQTAAALLGSLALAVSCASPAPPQGWQERLGAGPLPEPASNLPLEPAALETLLQTTDFEVRDARPAGSGVMGALRVEAWYPAAGREIAFKWKVAPEGGEGWNNTPRREIAAYQIQKWFLDPDSYVVPVTVANCIPLELHADIDDEAEPNLAGARCVFGTQTAWLEDVREAEPFYEPERFYAEPGYARHLAHYNLLSYLIENRDTREANRLVSTHPGDRRVYAVDNGISFGEWLFNWFRWHWNEIRVPALPVEAIERLRWVDDETLDSLRVVAHFEPDADGLLRPLDPARAEPFETGRGARRRGGALQLGLVPEEIEGLRDRIRELLAAVDAGEIPVF